MLDSADTAARWPRDSGRSATGRVVYYGGADTSIAVARGSVRAPLEWLDANGTPVRHAAGGQPFSVG
jgi:hypothetical protein